MMRFFLTFSVLVIVGGSLLVYFFFSEEKEGSVSHTPMSFEECTALGFPVQESYPRTCRGTDGRVFTEDIGNTLEKAEQVLVTYPLPGQKIQSPLTVKGQARGTWFFEGSFGVRLLDASEKQITEKGAEAQGEWMTEEFVPFEVTLTFPGEVTGTGVLLLEKANPSGLPEKEETVRIPIVFGRP